MTKNPPTLAQQLRQNLLGSVQGLQRLRAVAQLEREIKAQYARLGQLYTEQHPESELQALRGHILELRQQHNLLNTAPAQASAQTSAQSLEPTSDNATAVHLPVTGMAARIWQAKEEERDEAPETQE